MKAHSAPRSFFLIFSLLALFVSGFGSPLSGGLIPVTRAMDLDPYMRSRRGVVIQPVIEAVVRPLIQKEPDQLATITVEGAFSLPVIQQPFGQPGFVSPDPDVITQFSMPLQYGTTGLLAHNNLAGANFFELKINQPVTLTYKNGVTRQYGIRSIQQYQALEPTNAYSDFIDQEQPAHRISANDLFSQIYTQGDRVVFQTCIARNGNPSWGRIFIIATPI